MSLKYHLDDGSGQRQSFQDADDVRQPYIVAENTVCSWRHAGTIGIELITPVRVPAALAKCVP